MKRLRFLFVLVSLTVASSSVSAQEKTETVKSGWNVGLLPAFYYNNDLGFSVGILGQIFDYGDGSVYPNYRHKFMANVNFYSRGAKQIVLNYDSKHLIPGKRITADLSYMNNPLCGFYGFNGAASPYHADLDLKKSADETDGIAFYSNHQRLLNAKIDIQGNIARNLTWIGGLSYAYQRYDDTRFRVYDGTESLFHQYVENGLIPKSDTHGHRIELKTGVIYDSRDFEPNPEHGMYATMNMTGGTSFSNGTVSSLVLATDFRHYYPIIPSRLILAYQLSSKTLVTGSLPYYALPSFPMRGTFGSRITGNGVAWGSADLRLCITRFRAFKQNFELGLVGIADAGAVILPYKLSEQSSLGSVQVSRTLDGITYGPYASIYDPAIAEHEHIHCSAGGGFWYSMNKNFIVAVEFGKPFNTQDGTLGLYINLGFSF